MDASEAQAIAEQLAEIAKSSAEQAQAEQEQVEQLQAEPVEEISADTGWTSEDVQNALQLQADCVTCLLVCVALLACTLGAVVGAAAVRWWRV